VIKSHGIYLPFVTVIWGESAEEEGKKKERKREKRKKGKRKERILISGFHPKNKRITFIGMTGHQTTCLESVTC
jgi:hypothetical protein